MPSYFCRFTPREDSAHTLDTIAEYISKLTSQYVVSYEEKPRNNHYHIAIWDVPRSPEDLRYHLKRLNGSVYLSGKDIEDKIRTVAYTIKDGNYRMKGIDIATILMANSMKHKKVTFDESLQELIDTYDPNLYDDRWLAGGIVDLYQKHNRKPYTQHMRVLMQDIKLKKVRHYKQNMIDKILAYDQMSETRAQRFYRFRRHIHNAIAAVANPDLAPRIMDYAFTKNKVSRTNMAKRYTSKSKRRPRRRRVFRRKRIAVTQPNIIVRKLKTVYNGSIDCGAGTLVADVIATSGAADPTLGLGSGQPLGFDQYHALYQRNCVIGYKVKLQLCTTDNTNPVIMGFTPKTDATALTAYTHYKECKGTVSTILTPDIDKGYLSHKGSTKKWMLRRGSNILDNAALCGDATTNPSSLLYGHIWAQAMDGSANPAVVRYVLTIEQIVVFFQPIVPARS